MPNRRLADDDGGEADDDGADARGHVRKAVGLRKQRAAEGDQRIGERDAEIDLAAGVRRPGRAPCGDWRRSHASQTRSRFRGSARRATRAMTTRTPRNSGRT